MREVSKAIHKHFQVVMKPPSSLN